MSVFCLVVRRISVLKLVLYALCLLSTIVHASYLVRTSEPLSIAEFMRAYEIMGKHQFPLSLSYKSTGELDQDSSSCYHATSSGEQAAIEQELRAAGIVAQLKFVPDALYTSAMLYCINLIYPHSSQCPESSKKRFEHLRTAYSHQDTSLDLEKLRSLCSVGMPQEINNFFNRLLDQPQASATEYTDISDRIYAFWAYAEAYYFINNERITSSVHAYGDLYRSAPLAYYINTFLNVLLDRVMLPLDEGEDNLCLRISEQLLQLTGGGIVIDVTRLPYQEKRLEVTLDMRTVIDLAFKELRARKENSIVLYRDEGYSTNVELWQGSEDAYLRFLKPRYSRSYTAGFLHGFVSDNDCETGACVGIRIFSPQRMQAASNCQRNHLQDLSIVKLSRTQFLDSLHQILFVPPLTPIHGLLGSGEYWHPRTRMILDSKFNGWTEQSCPHEIAEDDEFNGIQDPSEDVTHFLLEKTKSVEEFNKLERLFNQAHY